MSTERRSYIRYESLFAVQVECPTLGICQCVARNISQGGILLETADPLPLGSEIKICFTAPGSKTEITANGTVRNHYYFNFGPQNSPKKVTGMGVRFTGFDSRGNQTLSVALENLQELH